MLSGFRINQILAKHTSRLQSFSTGQMAGFVECLFMVGLSLVFMKWNCLTALWLWLFWCMPDFQ